LIGDIDTEILDILEELRNSSFPYVTLNIIENIYNLKVIMEKCN